MPSPLVIDTSVHWLAVVLYAIATICNLTGLLFRKRWASRAARLFLFAGLLGHGGVLLYRWYYSGHGPYMTRYEILSSIAWIGLLLFLVFEKIFPKIQQISVVVFPATFITIGLAVFMNPAVRKLPPSLRSVWLVLHVLFYKISLGTLLIGLALSIFLLRPPGRTPARLSLLDDREDLDLLAYRFAGFGFVFWAIAMLAGSIWAYQAWGRFWNWDPIETWSLITWIGFGIYLHARRFHGWGGKRAAWLYLFCFLLSIAAYFGVPKLEATLHTEYLL